MDPGGPPPVARLSATTTNGPLQRTLTEMERRQRELAVDRDGSTQEVDSDSSVSSLQGASQSQSYIDDSVFDACVVRFPPHPPCLLDTVPVYNLLAQVHILPFGLPPRVCKLPSPYT